MRHIIILPPTLKSISADTGRIYNIPFLKGKAVSIPLGIYFSPGRKAFFLELLTSAVLLLRLMQIKLLKMEYTL